MPTRAVGGCLQVRDVEAGLQDALLDSFHDLVTSRAAAASATGAQPESPPDRETLTLP